MLFVKTVIVELFQAFFSQLRQRFSDLLIALGIVIWKLGTENFLILHNCCVKSCCSFVLCDLLPGRTDGGHFTWIKRVGERFDQIHHHGSIHRFSTKGFGSTSLDQFVSECKNSLDELPPQGMIGDTVKPLKFALVSHWSNHSDALTVFKVGQERFSDFFVGF